MVTLITSFLAGSFLGGTIIFLLIQSKICRLDTLASTDDLTSLFNSREFDRRLVKETQLARHRGNPLSLMLLDIDGFKQINDQWGYDSGDTLLKQFAQFIKSKIKATDLVFRYKYGDEFAVIVFGATPNETERFGQKLCRSLESHKFDLSRTDMTLRTLCISVTVSIGISDFDSLAPNSSHLRQRAELALKTAKKTTNTVVTNKYGVLSHNAAQIAPSIRCRPQVSIFRAPNG